MDPGVNPSSRVLVIGGGYTGQRFAAAAAAILSHFYYYDVLSRPLSTSINAASSTNGNSGKKTDQP